MNILSHIKEEILHCEVVSFDIFDTLILRPYYKPQDVFIHIERILGLKKFADKRIKAEKRARKLSPHDEITFNEIYQSIGEKYKTVESFESEFETRICQQNPEINEAYEYALNLGKRIIFVSDMYLPQGVVEIILDTNGYKSYEHLFLSSTYKQRKATGELYDVVIDKINVSPGKILHIGDNKKNDFENAKVKGLKAIYYPKVINRFMHEHKNMSLIFDSSYDKRFNTDYLTYSLIVGINSVVWIENLNDSYWMRFGSLYAGPFLYFFTRWLYSKAQINNIKNIALVARDGFNLKKIFDLFDNKKEFNTQYVYLPRYVSESANINSLEDLGMFLEGLGKTDESLRDFISIFSEENHLIKDLWSEFVMHHKYLTYKDMKSFVLDNSSLFIETSQMKKKMVYDYFYDLGLFSDSLMIVDSSCTKARPQKLLNSIVKSWDMDISLFGYYYKVNQRSEGLDQIEIRPEFSRKYQTDKWDLMEFFMSSPERPIISIKKELDQYKPVYKKIENSNFEKHRIKESELLSKGVVKFSQKAYNIFENFDIIKDLDTVVAYVNNIINNPTNKDVAHIKHLHHSVNNDNNYTPLILKDTSNYLEVRRIYGQRVQINRKSPEYENFFIGGGHRQISDSEQNTALALNVPHMNKLPSLNEEATICLISNGEITDRIDELNYWNFNVGASIQIRPKYKNQIIYNEYNEVTKRYFSIIYDQEKQISKSFDSILMNISNDGRWAVSIDSLNPSEQDFPNAIGYVKCKYENSESDVCEDQAIYFLDIDNDYKKKILSIDKIVHIFKDSETFVKGSHYYFNLIIFNPNSSRIFIQVERRNKQIENKTISLSVDVNGDNFYLYNAQMSNVQWKDNKNLIVTSSNISGQLAQDYESLYEIEDMTSDFRVIDKEYFNKEGNFSYHPNGRYLLFDKASHYDLPYRNLQLYDLHKKKGINLGLFHNDPELFSYNKLLMCELQPRWSLCGRSILFDSIHEGYKGVYEISGEEAIRELGREIESLTEEEVKNIIELASLNKKSISQKNTYKEIRRSIKKIMKYFIKGKVRFFLKRLGT